jgi:hypothetical protein
MLPLYAARIEDLGLGDFVKVDCATRHHVALLAPAYLLRLVANGRRAASNAASCPRVAARSASVAATFREPTPVATWRGSPSTFECAVRAGSMALAAWSMSIIMAR